MFNRKLGIAVVMALLAIMGCQAQSCNVHIQGKVLDQTSQSPVSLVSIFVQETRKSTLTDNQGNFLLDSLCVGEYHIQFSHIACEAKILHIKITQDTFLSIALSYAVNSLEPIVIKGQRDDFGNQLDISLDRKTIEGSTHKSLSGLLEDEAGIHLIKNGSGISKPVVHGLYGNRLIVLNNGIMQSGQQWGNDHSPEIDPFTADKISILKGINAIEYGGGNLGSIVLVEPRRVPNEPQVHGQVNYAYESNGKGHTLNTRLEKYSPLLAWRINATLKKYGDKQTANYLLNNTGIEEANLAIQLEKNWNNKLFLDFYGSTFNTRLGILRGSHIGNLTDLKEALTKEPPFFTEPDFSYHIDAPKQHVSHHLAKIKSKYLINENQSIELLIAGQINNRKEFDVRRSGRTDVPALSLLQYTVNSEIKYSHTFYNNWKLKIGNQYVLTDNTNNPETGILPLIPDYILWRSGIFSTLSKRSDMTHYNLGVRYDFEQQNVASISHDLPRNIIRYKNDFHNISALFTISYHMTSSQTWSLHTGYAMRNPGINELYSNGLHQGVSGIEEGDQNLHTEKAIKNTLEHKWFPNTHVTLNTLVYHQHFKNYIFLNPQEEVRLTIRGAFPVFRYQQTNANIYGLDISAQVSLSNVVLGMLKYSYIKGDDAKNKVPLVFMPPNSLFTSLTYQAKRALKLSPNVKIEEPEIEINNRWVFEQNHILAEQDFVQPPPAYNLFGLRVSSALIFPKYKIRCFAKSENVFNISYRDYLNRQRYFADDTGLSLTIGASLKF